MPSHNPQEEKPSLAPTRRSWLSRRSFLRAAAAVGAGAATLGMVDLERTPIVVADYTVAVDPSATLQTLEGWGTSLAWWANVIGGWPDTHRNELADLIFDPSRGLGLTIARYNIGGGDNPSHHHLRHGGAVPGFKASASADYDWSADANQRWVLHAAQARGANLFEAFSNSPPYWMTVSGCAAGNTDGGTDNLSPAYYDAFADYLTEVVKHYRDAWGITFRTLEPFNEPTGNWWTAYGSQEGCHFDRSTQALVIPKVAAAQARKRLSTTISAADENSIDDALLTVMNENSVWSSIAQINTHSYNGSARTLLHSVAASSGKRLWMSEFGTGAGATLSDIQGGLALSAQILSDMRELQPTAWIYWQVVEDAEYQDTWGMIQTAFASPTYRLTLAKQYYALAQYSRFIRPGATFLKMVDTNSLAAFDAVSGTLVLVTTNSTAADVQVRYDLSLFQITGTVSQYRTSSNENLAQVSGWSLVGTELVSIAKAKSITTTVITGISSKG